MNDDDDDDDLPKQGKWRDERWYVPKALKWQARCEA